jgi:hypothetical protein
MSRTHQNAPEQPNETKVPQQPDPEPADVQRGQLAPTIVNPRRQGIQRLPDGSIRMDLHLSAEATGYLESLAEEAQEDFQEYATRAINESVLIYMSQGV